MSNTIKINGRLVGLRCEDYTIKYLCDGGFVQKFKTGTIYYHNKLGVRHRSDGPAIMLINGERSWYVNGFRHRTNGPALITADGSEYWYIDGMPVDPPKG